MAKLKWPKEAKYFDIPLFGGELYICYDKEVYAKCLEYLNIEDSSKGCGGKAMMLQHEEGSVMYLMGVFFHDAGVIAHEAVHIAQYVTEHVGSEDNETSAYLVEAIVNFATKHLPKEPA